MIDLRNIDFSEIEKAGFLVDKKSFKKIDDEEIFTWVLGFMNYALIFIDERYFNCYKINPYTGNLKTIRRSEFSEDIGFSTDSIIEYLNTQMKNYKHFKKYQRKKLVEEL